jgi:hypothetical protein
MGRWLPGLRAAAALSPGLPEGAERCSLAAGAGAVAGLRHLQDLQAPAGTVSGQPSFGRLLVEPERALLCY